jgi:Fe-S cluster assembly protein SufD
MAEELKTIDTLGFFSSAYEENKTLFTEQSAPLLNDYRNQCMDLFRKTGIPGKQDERYKYTRLEKLFPSPISLALQPNSINIGLREIFKCDVPELDTTIILLLNGFYHDQNKPLLDLGHGAFAGSLAEASRRFPDLVRQHLWKSAHPEEDGLIALNGAFAQDGLFVYVPDHTILDKPIQVINMGMWDEDLMISQHNLFVIGEHSQARIIVCDHTLAPWKFITNTVTEIYTAKHGYIELANVQNENNSSARISSVCILQEEGSEATSNTISLHGGLIRNNLFATLGGQHCNNQAYGLYLTDRTQHIDNYTFIDHASPACTSSQLFKGVLDDQATGAFNGRILVRRNAQQTSAYQANNNILLTEEAKINTRPQLEIYADDVKCSHGATVGQLDDNALFYLRTRGIAMREARLMLMNAFAHEIISALSVLPLRERISDLVEKRLRGELSRCNSCQINCGNIECE